MVTAASDTYAQTFQSEINKDACSSNIVPDKWSFWSYRCKKITAALTLRVAKILDELTNDALKLQEDGVVYGVDYVEEDYGIICNKLLEGWL